MPSQSLRMSQAGAAYRQLLRTIRKRIDPRRASFWTAEAGRLFRSPTVALTDDGRQLLDDYCFLVHSVHDYKVGTAPERQTVCEGRPCLPAWLHGA